MAPTRLHYIYDPLCGWCYGAAPLVAAARERFPIIAHAGGMMAGPNRQPVSERLRHYVMPHDRRIAALTGQPFGEPYFDGLLRDHGAVFDSEPPITAILAAHEIAGPGRDLDMLARIQHAHYAEGRRIADPEILAELAAGIGLEAPAFTATYARLEGQPTRAHIAESRALLAHVGGQGFPTFALEHEGRLHVLDTGRFLGRVDEWRERLADISNLPARTPPSSAQGEPAAERH
ncbi:MAG: DsbA family protein [Pigmentiphaga sp.]|uniref:DsbA family protein n=1 Tax=Pigmentiphaga sp. TaxID=1977564 RepID=UPI0029A30138|nr:DsbA family protein [Pigmentiphaga sp.]MDX3905047.1 DsbA family protein [Pigmentiphaga sp.]